MEMLSKNRLHAAVRQVVSDMSDNRSPVILMPKSWAGFADAKPSESIQKHELPGLCVSTLFPVKEEEALFDVPVKQYKDAKTIKKKIRYAKVLTKWLDEQRESGLQIFGFCLTETQHVAAEYGLKLIEELPDVEVKSHHDTYRLFFSDHHVDFAQAVALEYYLFAAYFGILKASHLAKNRGMELVLYMDRFPGGSIGNVAPGDAIPKTDGKLFLEYVQEHSDTYRAIEDENKSAGLQVTLKTLDWWSPIGENKRFEGKDHPHFLLPDWLAAASTATHYRGEFIASYSSHKAAVRLANSLSDLYDAFKRFDIWSLGEGTLRHIVDGESKWSVPDDARKFILERAGR